MKQVEYKRWVAVTQLQYVTIEVADDWVQPDLEESDWCPWDEHYTDEWDETIDVADTGDWEVVS